MICLKKAIIMVCMVSVPLYGMEEKQEPVKQRKFSWIESTFVGGVTGASEALTGRPLDYLKTMKVLGGIVPKNPLKWYSGLSTHMVGIVPTTVFQGQAKSIFSQYMDSEKASALSGAVSTMLSCPLERCMLEQQTSSKSPSEIIKGFAGYKGLKNLYKGASAIALRELLFTIGYMNSVQAVEQQVAEYVQSPLGKSALAGIISGIPLALMSHPFESIRVWQQKDKGTTMFDVIKKMHQDKDGISKNLYKGGGYRTMRYCLALFVMSNVYKELSASLEKRG